MFVSANLNQFESSLLVSRFCSFIMSPWRSHQHPNSPGEIMHVASCLVCQPVSSLKWVSLEVNNSFSNIFLEPYRSTTSDSPLINAHWGSLMSVPLHKWRVPLCQVPVLLSTGKPLRDPWGGDTLRRSGERSTIKYHPSWTKCLIDPLAFFATAYKAFKSPELPWVSPCATTERVIDGKSVTAIWRHGLAHECNNLIIWSALPTMSATIWTAEQCSQQKRNQLSKLLSKETWLPVSTRVGFFIGPMSSYVVICLTSSIVQIERWIQR